MPRPVARASHSSEQYVYFRLSGVWTNRSDCIQTLSIMACASPSSVCGNVAVFGQSLPSQVIVTNAEITVGISLFSLCTNLRNVSETFALLYPASTAQ